ncbi:hypothetical protein AAFF41_47140 [Streptomyces mirabilis]
MASTRSGSVSQLSVRSYEAGDEQAVLDLIDADRLPGQPPPSAATLATLPLGEQPGVVYGYSGRDGERADDRLALCVELLRRPLVRVVQVDEDLVPHPHGNSQTSACAIRPAIAEAPEARQHELVPVERTAELAR